MGQENARKNKITIEERIDYLVHKNPASILHTEQDRIDFIRFIYMNLHSDADTINKIEFIIKLLHSLESTDKGLVNTLTSILQEKLVSVKTAYDPYDINKEFMSIVHKAVDTWKSKDDRKDFDYCIYINIAKDRIGGKQDEEKD